MKVLIVNTDYSEFLKGLYENYPTLDGERYDQQLKVRYASLFGVADFYSRNLRALGHDAHDIYINNLALQRAWLNEYDAARKRSADGMTTSQAIRRAPTGANGFVSSGTAFLRSLVKRFGAGNDEGMRILTAQVKHHRPDVLLNQAMDGIDSEWLYNIKPWVKLLVGQHAATALPEDGDYRCYDLVVSSFQPTIDFFRENGIPAVLHRLGFDPSALTEPPPAVLYPVTFVGSLSAVHRSRIEWLEQLCASLPELRVWGPGVHLLSKRSPLRERHMGLVWGKEMYAVLRRSKITLNHHGDVAPYANNCRLFEATGMGAMLLTDWKPNLQALFEIGKEVAAYRSTEECAEMVRHYLVHEEARSAIAQAGQARTLRDHTYLYRMREFVEIVQQRMAA